MLNCVIIDDEKNNREDLKAILEMKFSDRIHVTGMADSVKNGVTLINQTMPDVVFLDIRMPEEDGFKLFEKFDSIGFEVVFTTAFEKYAVEAIRHSAFDFLVKPVDPQDLKKLLDRLDKEGKKEDVMQKVKMLMNQLQQGPDSAVLVSLPVGKEYKVVNARDILYCQAQVNYTTIVLPEGKQVLVSKTLGTVEEILNYPFFFRCHKSYLVNLNWIDSYNRVDGYIRMKNGEEIYLAGRRIEDFINIFGKHHLP